MARLRPIKETLTKFRFAAEEIFINLWPAEALPGSLADLATSMREVAGRVLAWKRSAARAGAELTLTTVLSWHPGVIMTQLEAQREDFEPSAELTEAIHLRAQLLAPYADVDTFVEPEPEEEEAAEDDGEEADDGAQSDSALSDSGKMYASPKARG